MMMLCSAKKMEKRKDKLTIPGGSLDRLLMDLTLVRAEKRKNANAWIRNTRTPQAKSYLDPEVCHWSND